MQKYSWSMAYSSALVETDPERVVQKILEAERAIFVRSQEVGLEFHEIEAMGDAAIALQNLRDSHMLAN
jgi:hypothetical protein